MNFDHTTSPPPGPQIADENAIVNTSSQVPSGNNMLYSEMECDNTSVFKDINCPPALGWIAFYIRPEAAISTKE